MNEPQIDLATEMLAARREQLLCVACGDHETAALLAAWIDVLLDEWARGVAWKRS
jgi:hypothetical protein